MNHSQEPDNPNEDQPDSGKLAKQDHDTVLVQLGHALDGPLQDPRHADRAWWPEYAGPDLTNPGRVWVRFGPTRPDGSPIGPVPTSHDRDIPYPQTPDSTAST